MLPSLHDAKMHPLKSITCHPSSDSDDAGPCGTSRAARSASSRLHDCGRRRRQPRAHRVAVLHDA
jgi:hypothetical protein